MIIDILIKINDIFVQVNASTEESVLLTNITEATSGTYKCEVMGEGPAFRTAVKSKEMKVIGM